MGEHIDATVRKCHTLLGVLARASKVLPRKLLSLFYSSMISHLEYGSAVISTAAVTHLKKLDVIQRKAAKIVFGLPRDAHFSPLIEELQWEDLGEWRRQHIVQIVKNSLSSDCHLAFMNMFTANSDETTLSQANSK